MPSATVTGKGLMPVPPAVDICGNCKQQVAPGQLDSHVCPSPEAVGTPTTAVLGNMAMLMAPLGAGLGTREEIERELDGIALAVRSFPAKQPDQVMRECAAYTARLVELEVLLHRVESQDRQYVRVRTMQVERWRAELEFQWKVASRLIEVMRQDLSLHLGKNV